DPQTMELAEPQTMELAEPQTMEPADPQTMDPADPQTIELVEPQTMDPADPQTMDFPETLFASQPFRRLIPLEVSSGSDVLIDAKRDGDWTSAAITVGKIEPEAHSAT